MDLFLFPLFSAWSVFLLSIYEGLWCLGVCKLHVATPDHRSCWDKCYKNVDSGEEDIIKNKTVQTFLIRCCLFEADLPSWPVKPIISSLSTTLCC